MDRASAVAELKAVYGTLTADLDEALAYGKTKNTPYALRALVRAHFALIEGVSFHLRQVTVASLQGTGSRFLSGRDLELLQERRLSLDNSGRSKSTDSFLALPQSVPFTMRCYAKNHGADFSPNTSGRGWAAMREAVKIRNRVTHPKSAASLELTEEDQRSFRDAAVWWKDSLLEMFERCDEADAYWLEQLSHE